MDGPALLLASQDGHAEVVSILLAAGADFHHANPEGSTALIMASQGGHAEVVSILLAAGANVHHTTNDGSTALRYATLRNHPEVVTLLNNHIAQLAPAAAAANNN